MKKKGKLHIIIPLIVLVVIAIAYFWGWEIGAHFNEDTTAKDIETLTGMVSRDIDDGKSSEIYYISGITESEIRDINEHVCSLNGTVKKYVYVGSAKGGQRLMLTFETSDNYYVFRKYKYGEEIPSGHPEAHKLYEEVVKVIDNCITDDMTEYEKELALHDYIIYNCDYGYTDYSEEYAYTSYGALVQGKAVCSGYAEAFALLLSCTDIENEIQTGTGDGELHAWNVVNIDGQWYQVDITWDDPITEEVRTTENHMYFNVTDDLMDDNHVWKSNNNYTCNSDKYNYYVYNGLIGNSETIRSKYMSMSREELSRTIEFIITDFTVSNGLDFIYEKTGVYSCEYMMDSYGRDTFIMIYLN